MIAALVALLAGCAHEPPGAAPRCEGAESVVVPTADGAAIALHRHRAPGPPVLLVHGISSNHHVWDLGPGRSLANALQGAGYDAWLLDLRGHGDARTDAAGRRLRPRWSVDDYGRYDIPAAIDHVRGATGYDRVAYVGHSMGGMVAAIYHGLHGDGALAALVVVASPIDFGRPDPLLALGGASMVAGSVLPWVHTPAMADVAAALPRAPLKGDELLFAPDNLRGEARKAMYREVVSPLSRGELRQFSRVVRDGGFRSEDGSVDYAAALATLDVPLLVVGGRADRVASADRVRAWIELSGSADERWVLAGRANGFRHDYGHMDLPVGDSAAEEIYPLVTGWLAERWPPSAPGR